MLLISSYVIQDFNSFLQPSLLANVAVILIPVSDQSKKSLNSVCKQQGIYLHELVFIMQNNANC